MIRILVDSAADFSKKEIEEKGIHLVPLQVNFQEEQYLDGVNLERDDYMIRILVDSAADFSKKEIEEKGIHLVPLQVNFQEEQYLDGVNLERDEFYEKLVLDSAADFSKKEIEEKGIHLVPLQVNFQEEQYLDGVNLERDEFYEKLVCGKDFPKTSQPSPQEFLDVFEEVKEKGDELICILLSSALSGTCQSAQLARRVLAKVHSLPAVWQIMIRFTL